MAQPVCLNCMADMNVAKSGVAVIRKHPSGSILLVKFGDRYICPGCGNQIITGFGNPMYHGEYSQEHLKALIGKREVYEMFK